MALHMANYEEWQPRVMQLLFEKALSQAAH